MLFKALLALAFITMFFRWFEHNQVYHPNRTLAAHASDLRRAFEDVSFKTSDGVTLHA